MIVRLTLQAESDIGEIGDYIAQNSPARAISFAAEIHAKCLSLAELAVGFPVVLRRRGSEVRRRVHGSYAIFYVVQPTHILVLRVLHGARDFRSILPAD